jgi:hypothetical protein
VIQAKVVEAQCFNHGAEIGLRGEIDWHELFGSPLNVRDDFAAHLLDYFVSTHV